MYIYQVRERQQLPLRPLLLVLSRKGSNSPPSPSPILYKYHLSVFVALWFHNVVAQEFSVAVNVFWKNLDHSLYDSKDTYGNKDLVAAARAQQGVDKAMRALQALPADYRQFYMLRTISSLQQKYDDTYRSPGGG